MFLLLSKIDSKWEIVPSLYFFNIKIKIQILKKYLLDSKAIHYPAIDMNDQGKHRQYI